MNLKNFVKENKPFKAIKTTTKHKNLSHIYKEEGFKGTVMQFEKALTNDCLGFSNLS